MTEEASTLALWPSDGADPEAVLDAVLATGLGHVTADYEDGLVIHVDGVSPAQSARLLRTALEVDPLVFTTARACPPSA